MKKDLKNPSWYTFICSRAIFAIVVIGLSVFVNILINSLYINSKNFQKIEITTNNVNNKELRTVLKDNYNDYLIRHYETQIDFLNFWLTLLAIFAGFAGIGIPLIMNVSYKDKIKLMDREFRLKKAEIAKVNQNAKETLTVLKNNFNDDLLQKIDELENLAKQTNVFSKVSAANSLLSEATNYLKDNYEPYIAMDKLNKAMVVSEEIFAEDNNNLEVLYLLARLHGARAVIHKILKNIPDTIKDYNDAIKFAKMVEDEGLMGLGYEQLTQEYIKNDQFEKALTTIEEFKEDIIKPTIGDEIISSINSKDENTPLVKEIKEKLYEIRNISSQRGDFL